MSIADDIIKSLESAIIMERNGRYMYSKKYRVEKIEQFGSPNPIYENIEGCICYPAYLNVGERGWMLCEYKREDEWLAYPHRLHTSVIKDVKYTDDRIVITTEHTRLTLEVAAE